MSKHLDQYGLAPRSTSSIKRARLTVHVEEDVECWQVIGMESTEKHVLDGKGARKPHSKNNNERRILLGSANLHNSMDDPSGCRR